MDAKEAKRLLEDVPSDNFIVDHYTDGEGKCCAIGHLARLTSEDPKDYSFSNCYEKGGISEFVRITTGKFVREEHGVTGLCDLSSVNNYNSVNGYNEDTPKERVMHLLDDMVKAGY